MKKPENMRSVTRSFNRANQQGDADLHSDGMVNAVKPRDTRPDYGYNQHTGRANSGELQNYGRPAANLVGNTGRDLNQGPKRPPVPGGVPDFRAAARRAAEDRLNAGAQVREPGGTRKWAPNAQENYQGNFDQINEGRGPTRGNQQ
jgi:hypothetical protein